MDQRKSGIPLLASFPDLSEHGADHKEDAGLLKSSGRLFSQAMSAKLLAGITLFLLVGAVLPFCLKSASREMPLGDSLVASQPKTSKTTARTDDSPILAPTRRPAVRVAAAKERTPAPLRPMSEPKAAPPMMSSWPNPAPANLQPEADGHEATPASFERPVPARPTEYQADTRADSIPGNDREIRH